MWIPILSEGSAALSSHAMLNCWNRYAVQVHDEVIMEGPQQSADRAQQLVVENMEKPFNGQNPLKVALVVDSNTAETWYEAK